MPNNPLPRLTQMLRYKDFSTLDDIKIEKITQSYILGVDIIFILLYK